MNSYKENLTFGATPDIFEKANSLKKVMTGAEDLLWQELRNKKLDNTKFRRQHPISQFIVDFYCHEKNLVVEVDGSIHDVEAVKERDKGRTYLLEELELKVIRFKNEEIFENIELVLEKIRFYLR